MPMGILPGALERMPFMSMLRNMLQRRGQTQLPQLGNPMSSMGPTAGATHQGDPFMSGGGAAGGTPGLAPGLGNEPIGAQTREGMDGGIGINPPASGLGGGAGLPDTIQGAHPGPQVMDAPPTQLGPGDAIQPGMRPPAGQTLAPPIQNMGVRQGMISPRGARRRMF